MLSNETVGEYIVMTFLKGNSSMHTKCCKSRLALGLMMLLLSIILWEHPCMGTEVHINKTAKMLLVRANSWKSQLHQRRQVQQSGCL